MESSSDSNMAQQQIEQLSMTEEFHIPFKIEADDDADPLGVKQEWGDAESSQDDSIEIKPESDTVDFECGETNENLLITCVKTESNENCDQTLIADHESDEDEETNLPKVPVLSAPGIPNIQPLPSAIELERAEARRLIAEKQMFSCDECDTKFTFKNSLTRHKKNFHTDNDNLLSCDPEKNTGAKVRRVKQAKCDQCNKKLSSIKTLRSHIMTYHGPVFTCTVCSKPFYLESDFKKHCHDTEKPYSCDACEKRFQYEIWLERHKVAAHTKPFSCDVCGKRFTKNCLLVRHKPVHSGDRRYKCELCPKRFKQKFSLRHHRETHSGDLRYCCDVCNRRFLSKAQMKAHIKGHRDKQFQCDVCDKKFRVKSLLEYHKPVHYGDKPFACESCGERFTDKLSWLSHLIGHDNEKRYQCDICEKGFQLKVSLVGHIKRVHDEEKPYSCEICGKNYALKQHYDRHSKTHKD